MKNIFPERINRYKGNLNPQILFSTRANHNICRYIEMNLKKLSQNYYSINGLTILKVEWHDLKKFYKLPSEINCYTAFYMSKAIVVGTIQESDYETYEEFFLKCLEISSQQTDFYDLTKIFTDECVDITYKNNNCKYKIISMYSLNNVYQFNHKRKYIKSK